MALALTAESVASLLHTKLAQIDKVIMDHQDTRCEEYASLVHPYCDLNDTDQRLVERLWSVLEWKAANTFVEKESELDELIEPRFRRIAKHEHRCGQRNTSGPVIVESA